MVKPVSVAARVSPFLGTTTDPAAPPSITVSAITPGASGSMLVTLMFLPLKSRFSLYTPAATRTVSPAAAALMAAGSWGRAPTARRAFRREAVMQHLRKRVHTATGG